MRRGVRPRRARGLLGLSALALGAALAAGPARAAPDSSATPTTGRRAVIEIGLPPATPSALDSIPHPWPGRALLLSAAGTLAPIALLAGGDGDDATGRAMAAAALEVATPAAGHLYAGLTRRALIGMAVRAVGFGLAANALSSESGEFDWDVVMALGGMAIVGVSAIVDVVTVPLDVERANRARLARRATVGVRLTSSGRAPALALSARF